MVAITGPASPSPSDIPRASAASSALDRLKQRPVPTEAQADAFARLETVRAEMREAPKKAAAAKVAYLRNKLMAIKLAAGTAAATGDPKFAHSAMREMRALTKELAQALKDAGLAKDAAALPAPEAEVRPAGGKASIVAAAPKQDDLTQAREDAKGVVKELKKIVEKLRIAIAAARLRGASENEIAELEKQLRDGEKELRGLSADIDSKSPGPSLDVKA